MSGAVFSDSWFRVANARVALLASAKVQKQEFRGKSWYVLRDSFSHRYFRIAPEAYAFVSQLSPDRTVEEVWLDFVENHPEDAPGQEEVVRVLSQLHVANLLYFQERPDNTAIFARSQKQRQREILAKVMAFLYWRIYLFDPDRLLNRFDRLIRIVTSPVALIVWVLVVFRGGAVALENWTALSDSSQGLFSLSNLPWLYLCLAVMKLLHEAGHAFVCKRFGGEVHAFGVMFLILTPLPYVDMASTWAFKNRYHRAYVGVAGMMVELFLAALGAMVWSQTGAGLVNSLAFNVMVIGSVSSLLFNGNPLLRFDAYYILADLTDMPNLYQKAQQQWLYFGDRYLLGTPTAQSPATDRREWQWFTVYGVLAFFYRLWITVGIVMFVIGQWFVIGVLMAGITVTTMFIMPAIKLFAYLNGPRVQQNRQQAQIVVASIILVVLCGGAFVPLPYSIQAYGVLEADKSSVLHAPADGTLVRIAAQSGDALQSGAVIAELSSSDLDYENELLNQEIRASEQLFRKAVMNTPADVDPIKARLDSLNVQSHELGELKRKLLVRAPHEGEWVAPALHERVGAWVLRGQVLGELVQGKHYRFVAVVRQEQADELFEYQHEEILLRLAGQTDETIEVSQLVVIPYQRERLSSSALGWAGGGEMAVKTDDKSGEVTTEPFFELRAVLPDEQLKLLRPVHGLSGILHIRLPGQSLFWQMSRALTQLFQKRFGVMTGIAW